MTTVRPYSKKYPLGSYSRIKRASASGT